ncbi:hypothetical protein RYX36_017064 [Vicia faba]
MTFLVIVKGSGHIDKIDALNAYIAGSPNSNSTTITTLRPPQAAPYLTTCWTSSDTRNLIDHPDLSIPLALRSNTVGFMYHYSSITAKSMGSKKWFSFNMKLAPSATRLKLF